jgi:hypothetical protein
VRRLLFFAGGRSGARRTALDGVESAISLRSNQGMAGAYATLVGLEGSYVDVGNENVTTMNAWGYDGFFAFRPLGDSIQNTNLTLFYGLQFRNEAGAFIDFSLLRIFGVWSQDFRSRVDAVTAAKSERKRESIDAGLKLFF